MKVEGRHYRTIRPLEGDRSVEVIDQTVLPHRFAMLKLDNVEAAVEAIKTMVVRGAPLIGATAAYGLALALRRDPSDAELARAYAPVASLAADGCQFAPCARRCARRRQRAARLARGRTRHGDGPAKFAKRMSSFARA